MAKSSKTKKGGRRIGRIEDDTPILPYVVADGVVEEVERFLGKRIRNREAAVDYLAGRADATYRANKRFRKRIRGRGDSGLDWLFSFMRHWLSAWMLKHDRKTYESIPKFQRTEFANGLPLRWFR